MHVWIISLRGWWGVVMFQLIVFPFLFPPPLGPGEGALLFAPLRSRLGECTGGYNQEFPPWIVLLCSPFPLVVCVGFSPCLCGSIIPCIPFISIKLGTGDLALIPVAIRYFALCPHPFLLDVPSDFPFFPFSFFTCLACSAAFSFSFPFPSFWFVVFAFPFLSFLFLFFFGVLSELVWVGLA